jgi:hypothetical protein
MGGGAVDRTGPRGGRRKTRIGCRKARSEAPPFGGAFVNLWNKRHIFPGRSNEVDLV